MKINSTKDHDFHIDIEDAGDWLLLSCITSDAMSRDNNLSHSLGEFITDNEVAPDWLEYIVPELDTRFSTALIHVTAAIAAARDEFKGGPGPLWIRGDDAYHWYSALNQARLALEQSYHFGRNDNVNPADLSPDIRSAFLRSQLYCAIQSLLLSRGIG